MIGTFQRAMLFAVCLLLASGVPAPADDGPETTVRGTILDAAGEPLPEYRVVARLADSSEVFLSQPSDAEGRYRLLVPMGGTYEFVAVIAPNAARVALPAPETLQAQRPEMSKDLSVPVTPTKNPRADIDRLGGPDRMFLSFIEDPAAVGRQYWELQVGSSLDTTMPDLGAARLVGAFGIGRLSRVEVGARLGYGRISPPLAEKESGALDVDLWGKYRVHGSADGKWNLSLGVVATLPSGDHQVGLGTDAARGTLFVAVSRAFPMVVVLGHVGAVAGADGQIAGQPLRSQGAVAAGLGVIMPLAEGVGWVFETRHDGARFKETRSDTRLSTGVNWQVSWRGKLRAAVAAGLSDTASDVEFLVGYAMAF